MIHRSKRMYLLGIKFRLASITILASVCGTGVAAASIGAVELPNESGSILVDPIVFTPPVTTDGSGVISAGPDVTIGNEGDGSIGSIDPQILETAIPATRNMEPLK